MRPGWPHCNLRCRRKSPRRLPREANYRHQQSPQGHLDHRHRQCTYRRRLGTPPLGISLPSNKGPACSIDRNDASFCEAIQEEKKTDIRFGVMFFGSQRNLPQLESVYTWIGWCLHRF
jgi:hypothetical protein